MKSIRLHPFSNGMNGTVTFTGTKPGGGSPASVTFNTGTSLGGIVHQFPGTFTDLEMLTWTVNNNQAGLAYHQFDNLVAILPPVVSIPPSLTLSEGHGPHALQILLDGPLPNNVTLAYTVTGTATPSSDYTTVLIWRIGRRLVAGMATEWVPFGPADRPLRNSGALNER